MDINCASFESSLPEVYLILPRATYVKEIFLVHLFPSCSAITHLYGPFLAQISLFGLFYSHFASKMLFGHLSTALQDMRPPSPLCVNVASGGGYQ